MKAKIDKADKGQEKTQSITRANPKVDQLINDLGAFIKFEKHLVVKMFLEKIKINSSDKSGFNAEKLLAVFKKVHQSAETSEEKSWILSTWKNESTSLEKKALRLARFLAKKYEIPSRVSVEHLKQLLGIIYTDTELNSFISNPQKYIESHSNLSIHQLQVLQFVANDPVFNKLPSINRIVPSNSFIYTPLTAYMAQLKLKDYGSTDALRFTQCINPDFEAEVIEKSKKNYHGPQIIGMGVQSSYDRKSIAQTATQVKKMQMGACHTFAQLAADELLSLIEQGKLSPMHIKIVSHKEGLGSHTFLLINHNSDDLTDLSGALIVDPWAVAMGYRDTYGIFTTTNYPYLAMTTKLECSYDNQAPVVSNQQESSLVQELSHTLSRDRFFQRSTSRNQTEVKLDFKQRTAVEYLTGLMKYADNTLGNAIKKDLMIKLIDAVKNKDLSPEKAINQATLAIYARSIEKNEHGYSWKGKTSIDDESILPIVNSESMLKYWYTYFSDSTGTDAKKGQVKNPLDLAMIEKIVNSLDKTEDHEFSSNSKMEHKI
ncbi:hypothetical protein Lnau_1024 [Legionella nautarum]|uniref:Uncharacterized protein n=1 Tax=Legionella nautarum TaxID=45070 RepID=A0A0W0WUR0_9GAMM|nr:hypothetical protein [Legionella nautarum]KTD36040.1 hypothetical protein Lnau_1024 [Legionella nautarum]